MTDVVIVGGGPAGLACAIQAARRGLSTVVLERSPAPPDKACGEGLMPAGARLLDELGIRARLSPDDSSPFLGIRYVQEDGTSVEGRFPHGSGLGVRRTALATALVDRARELGAEVRLGASVIGTAPAAGCVRVATREDVLEARFVVAADGLASPLRRAAGLEGAKAHGRFGLRQHVRVAPWSDLVEVHWGERTEAYVTPVGRDRVNLLFQWDPRTLRGPASISHFLERFPAIAERVRGAPMDSLHRGLGPLVRSSRCRVADRLALVGDAAGFVDGITGEGLTIAFRCAAVLGELLPRALRRDASRAALMPYELFFRREYRRYELLTHGLLAISGRPELRRLALRGLARWPRAFESILVRVAAA